MICLLSRISLMELAAFNSDINFPNSLFVARSDRSSVIAESVEMTNSLSSKMRWSDSSTALLLASSSAVGAVEGFFPNIIVVSADRVLIE